MKTTATVVVTLMSVMVSAASHAAITLTNSTAPARDPYGALFVGPFDLAPGNLLPDYVEPAGDPAAIAANHGAAPLQYALFDPPVAPPRIGDGGRIPNAPLQLPGGIYYAAPDFNDAPTSNPEPSSLLYLAVVASIFGGNAWWRRRRLTR